MNIFFPEEEHFASHRFREDDLHHGSHDSCGSSKNPSSSSLSTSQALQLFFFFLHKYSSVLVSTAADETTS